MLSSRHKKDGGEFTKTTPAVFQTNPLYKEGLDMSLNHTDFPPNLKGETPLSALIGEQQVLEALIGDTIPDGKGGFYEGLCERSQRLHESLYATRAAHIGEVIWRLCDLRSILVDDENRETYMARMLEAAIFDLTVLNKGALS